MKRISILLCSLVLAVVAFVVPVSAAEDSSIKIVQQPVDYISSSGKYTFSFSIVVSGDVSRYQWQESRDGVKWSNVYGTDYSGRTANFYSSGTKNWSGLQYRCVVTGADGTVLTSDVVGLYFVEIPILHSVRSSIRFVISWIGSFCDSLLDPAGSLFPLLPVLAVGISVSVLLVVVKIAKSVSWGV